MKKYFLSFTATAIFVLSFAYVNAQKSAYAIAGDIKSMKAYVSANNAATETKNDKSALYKINFKAVSDFKNTYKDISDETWEVKKDGYVARFVFNSIRTLNCYAKNGKWLHSIQYYDETKLPKNVRALVKSNYYDYSITSVQEVNLTKNNQNPIYLVYIAYHEDHKTIRACDGEMEEINL